MPQKTFTIDFRPNQTIFDRVLAFFKRNPFLTFGVIASIVLFFVGLALSFTGVGAIIGAGLISLGVKGLAFNLGCGVFGVAIGMFLAGIGKLLFGNRVHNNHVVEVNKPNYSEYLSVENTDNSVKKDQPSKEIYKINEKIQEKKVENVPSKNNEYDTTLRIKILGAGTNDRLSFLYKYEHNRFQSDYQKLLLDDTITGEIIKDKVKMVVSPNYGEGVVIDDNNHVFIIMTDMTARNWRLDIHAELRRITQNGNENAMVFIVGFQSNDAPLQITEEGLKEFAKNQNEHAKKAGNTYTIIGASSIDIKTESSESIDNKVFKICRDETHDIRHNSQFMKMQ